MTTYVTATPNRADATVRVRVEAREDGYEDALNLDAWELDALGVLAEYSNWTLSDAVSSVATGGRWLAFAIAHAPTPQVLARTVAGLDVGDTYRVLIGARPLFVGSSSAAPVWTFGVQGKALKAYHANMAGNASDGGYADSDSGRTVFVYEFTATATTHDVVLVADTSAGGAAQLEVFSLVVQRTPSTRAVKETYGQVADDASWTLSGAVPVGVVRSTVPTVWGTPTDRSIGMQVENASSGSVQVPAESQRMQLTITGLTVGLTYTARVYVTTDRVPRPSPPPWVRLQVVGVGASDPLAGGWQRLRFVAAATSHVLQVVMVNAVELVPAEWTEVQVHYARVDVETEVADLRRVVGLTRSDANGARDVREVAGVRMEDGTLILTDHEPALVGSVTYTVATQRIDVPVPSSTTEVATAQTRLDLTGNRFTQVVAPRLSASSPIVEVYEAEQPSAGVAHDVIDRADPLVTKGVLRTRRGRLTVWWPTYAAALAFTHLFDTGDEVLWRQDTYPGLDMYFIRSSVRTSPYQAHTATRRWSVEIDYVEVGFPTVPIAGDATWNYREGALRNATYWDDLREFATYADRLNGPAVEA